MAKPSLSASPEGLHLASQALTKAGWTQKQLAAMVGCSRQPVTNFFKGEAISQVLFMGICDRIGLDWQVIAGLSSPPSMVSASPQPLASAAITVDDIVNQLRRQVYPSIRERCGTMRVLDMSHPIGVHDIYTSVNILEQISGRRHQHIEALLARCDREDFERVGLGPVLEERMPALDAVQTYRKLILLGKPGAGKTTFLKHLAIQCNEGAFEADHVPIFVTLKDFAEAGGRPGLLDYISHRDLYPYAPHGAAIDQGQLSADFYRVLHSGHGLVLLDGLDEVRGEDHQRVIREIRNFSEQFWRSQFVMTCRIAAWDYVFEPFTEVEVADFDDAQVADFAHKWFRHKPIDAVTFLRHLDQRPRIKQLTVSPLLLTLVCLAFEESGECPSSRSELYREGIDALLKKWDAKRGIQREQVYRQLSHQRKADLLSYIALITFQQKDYFMKQGMVEHYIADYIRHFSKTHPAADELHLDSEAILRSIEAQHGLLIERAKGIYSFSHLTFHEYFAAREIVFNSPSLTTTCQSLVNHLWERRWREVFLLTTELLRDAALLLLPMKQAVDHLLADCQRLQQFLQDICDRSAALDLADIKPAAVRAFYFDVDFDIDENRAVALQVDRQANLLVCASFLTRMVDGLSLQDGIAAARQYDATHQITAAPSANAVMLIAIQIALTCRDLNSDQRTTLKTLLQRLNHHTQDDDTIKHVADSARAAAKARHHIEQHWHFTAAEKTLLRQYYYGTQLLVDCLNRDGCRLAPEQRQHLEDTLFLPLQST
ncbi:putative NTPase NACHT family protein [Halomicronema hongdechloris C2206]|uniref:NTPase NACHT family protein n=1 Tax=Halomicronema hongdechloris C2206 TaxID=1641165 RepID=A0A1Z3HJU6_9CYAN|nr:NACHT domain-containing NTPase [Halomicronema hongdechloris]ASC70581.1 putative NTPase NACHT family protein [Halomicronema hongdechloris C2206]